MDFYSFCLTFALFTAVTAYARYEHYQHQAAAWRREKRNFRVLRTSDVLRFALPVSSTATTAVWLTLTAPVLAMMIAAGLLGYRFQRAVNV